jgi:pilus assembly protein CpaF
MRSTDYVLGGWDAEPAQPPRRRAAAAARGLPPSAGPPGRLPVVATAVPGPERMSAADWAEVTRMRELVATYLAEYSEADQGRRLTVADMRQVGQAYIAELVRDLVERRSQAGIPLSAAAENVWRKAVFDAAFGLGRLQSYVDDIANVANVDVYGFDDVVVEYRGGRLARVPPRWRPPTPTSSR